MGHGGRDDKEWTGTYAPFYDATLEGIPESWYYGKGAAIYEPIPDIGTDPQMLYARPSDFSEGEREYTRPTFHRDTAEAPSMWGANAQGDGSVTGPPVRGEEGEEVPTFGVDYSGVRRIEEMYAAGYLSLAEAEELRRQEIQNIYADLYAQYDAGAEEWATRQLATEAMLEGKRQTLTDELASYGYDSSGFDAEMQGIDEIRGMNQEASGDLLDRISEIARTGEAGALSGLSESAMMAKTGMEMQEMAAIEAETQRARAAAAAEQAAYLENAQNEQDWLLTGQILGLPPQVAQSLDATGFLDEWIDMTREDAKAAAEEADYAAQLSLGAQLLLDDPELGAVYELINNSPILAESFGFGVSPQPLKWETMAYENPELAAIAFPEAQQMMTDSFGDMSWNDAMLMTMLMALYGQTEGNPFFESP